MNNFIHILLPGFLIGLIFIKVIQTSTSDIKENFDIQPFLDKVVEQMIPLPLPDDNQGTKRQNKSELVKGRQISLIPTTAFISRRSFNTACAFTIPLFTFTLPTTAPTNSPVFMANQFGYGLFGVILVLGCFFVPVVFSGIRDPTLTGRSNVGQTQEILNRLLAPHPMVDFMGTDSKYKIGLDSSKCLLRTICQSQRSPENKQYGLLALPFQIFFPPPPIDKDDYHSSAAQIAARIGKYGTEKCGEVYKCFFDILDLALYFRNLYTEENYD